MSLEHDFNWSRFRPGDPGGFYESWFQRANHPTRPLAFWIRYTVFSPRGRPADAIGEVWAVWFDGESGRHVVAKSEVPLAQCDFNPERLHVRVGGAELADGRLAGGAESRGHRINWELEFSGDAAPLYLLPPELYARGLPKAKSLVGLPLARYRGTLTVDGTAHAIADWVGSQNHNWGQKHTDRYAWGQVAGFDDTPGSFLELATGQLKLGPLWTPRLTPLVLRHDGREFALRSIGQALRSRGRFGYFHWNFHARSPEVEVKGVISAPPANFVGLRYYNPPGGEKWCLNSKLASCRVEVTRRGRPPDVLQTRHRAAFELLTDDTSHGIAIRT